jgi:hypothetical protein
MSVPVDDTYKCLCVEMKACERLREKNG